MATAGDRMEYLILLLSGLTLICAVHLGNHGVFYKGPTEVLEGDALQITCILSTRDPVLWTINTSRPILNENELGYEIIKGEEGPYHKELKLVVQHTLLYHEGEYRCNRNSRKFHYVNVKPAFSEDGGYDVYDFEDDVVDADGDEKDDVIDGDDDDDKKDDDEDEKSSSSYEYKLEVYETYEFDCVTSKGGNWPVRWYKDGRHIVEKANSNVEIKGNKLSIKEAQEEDAGEYMCVVEAPHLGEGRIFKLVRAPKVIRFPGVILLVQGDELDLQCKTDGYQEPKITWIIGNLLSASLMKRDRRMTVHNRTTSSLTVVIKNVTVKDGGLYTCRAENTIDSKFPDIDEDSVYVNVRENMILVNEDYPGMGKVLTPGELLELVCYTVSCHHCTVVWFKDGEQLRNTSDYLKIYDNNTVIIQHSTYNDSGIYTCKVNRTILDVDLQATIVVQSKINLKTFDQSSVVVQGSPLGLYCQAEGKPMPQIKWYRGDEELAEGDDERVKIDDHEGLKKAKLIIENATFSDQNHYRCEAFNQVDSVNTTTFITITDVVDSGISFPPKALLLTLCACVLHVLLIL